MYMDTYKGHRNKHVLVYILGAQTCIHARDTETNMDTYKGHRHVYIQETQK